MSVNILFIRRLVALFGVLGWLIVPISTVRAFSLRPAILEMEGDRGQEIHGAVEVANDEKIAKLFHVSVQRFVPEDNYGRQLFLPVEEREGLPSWISVTTTVALGPGQSKKIPFQVHIPSDAVAGGYYGAIFFTTVVGRGSQNLAIGSRTGSLLFFTVHGDARPEIHVELFEQQRGKYLFWPQNFTIRLKNQGSLHDTPEGFVLIRNIFGQISQLIPINPEGGRILPQSTRAFDLSWKAGEMCQDFIACVRHEVEFFGAGPYTVQLSWSRSGIPPVRPLYFFIFPWRTVFVILCLVVVFVFMKRTYQNLRSY